MVFSYAFRKRVLQKSANILLCAIVLQASFTFILPFKAAAAEPLGAKELEDPDHYEEISFTTKAKLFITGDTEPQKVEKYDPVIGGFSLKVGSKDSLGDISVRIVKGDDSQTEILKIEGADDYYGETLDENFEQKTSGLFIFPEGIKEIQFYYGGEVEFEIFTIEKDKKPENPKIQPSEFYTTVENEKAYRKKLFSQMGLSIITRTEWGAPLTSTWGPTIADVNRIVVHHTATSVDMADPSNTVRAIYNSHYYRCANNNGSYNPSDPNCNDTNELWQDIGYNYLIDPQGRIYEGRAGGNGVIGAHAIPNSGSIGISILGNYSSQRPTTAAYNTLTHLISALSDLNGFDPVWKQSMYGHRDFMITACPGQTMYNDLDDITVNARNMSTTTILSQTKTKTDALTDNRSYLEQSGDAQLIVDVTNTPADIKAKLLLPSRGVEEVTQEGNNLFYKVSEGLMDQVVAETLLVDPNTKAQPNFKYALQSWTTTGSRSVPSDLDEGESDMHWNLERINMPEAWNELGGCASDASCGGDPSVVVAIVDTGVAHENYSFDAGTDTSYTVEDFGGIYIEYPTNDTLDGTYQNGTSYQGYERAYTQSPELGNVNFVNPYDAVQDYFCELREGDLDATNDCNAAELAKINHANDDHGHGTFGATIIAGDTSDAAPNRIVGIAHNVSIMPIKAFYPNDTSMCQTSTGVLDLTCADPNYDDRVVGNTFVISQGIQHAITNGADVINLSFRGIGTDPYMESVINQAAAAGIIVVAASGNDNIDITNVFPAGFDNVIAVGASDGDSNRAAYSNYGAKLDLVAPVGDTGLTLSSHTYSCYANTCSDETNQNLFSVFTSNEETPAPKKATGTSFAAPQVSAVAALLKAERASLNFRQTYNLITANTSQLGGSYFNNFTGYGLLNAEKTTDYLVNTVNSTTNPNANPSPNDDNRTDIVAFNKFNRQVDITLSHGTNFGGGYGGYQVWLPGGTFDSNYNLLRPADVDGDGDEDIVALNTSTTAVFVSLADGNLYRQPVMWNSNTTYNTIAWKLLDPADVNGDGKSDMIAFNIYDTSISVMLSDGLSFAGGNQGGQLWNSFSAYAPKDWELLSPFDVNGDNKADIIAFNFITTAIDVTLSTGVNFGGGNRGYQVWNSKSAYSTSNWSLLAPEDVNNDGRGDIIAFNKNTTAIDVTLSNGSNFGGGYLGYEVWNSSSAYNTTNWLLLNPSDVNGDGRADIIALNKNDTKIDVTLSTGTNFGNGYLGYQVWNIRSFYSTYDWTVLN